MSDLNEIIDQYRSYNEMFNNSAGIVPTWKLNEMVHFLLATTGEMMKALQKMEKERRIG